MSVQPTSSSPTPPVPAGAPKLALLAPDAAPGAAPGAAPSAAPNARDEAIDFARAVMDSPNSPYTRFAPADRGYGSVIHNALRTLGNAYASSAPADRPAIAQDGDRLLGFAREAGLVAPGRSFAALYKNSRPAAPPVAAEQPRPAAAPAAAAAAAPAPAAGPAPVAASVAPATTPAAAPSRPAPQSPRGSYDAEPLITPSGNGTNASASPRLFQGASVGTTTRPRNWYDIPKANGNQPGWYVSAGVSATGVTVLPGNHADIVNPATTVVAGASNGKQAVQVRVMQEIEPGVDGVKDWRVGGSFISKEGPWLVRLDGQAFSADPLPGAPANSGTGIGWAGHGTVFYQLNDTNRLRARVTTAYSGRKEERVGVGASLFLNPLPDAGYFPTHKDLRVGGGVDYQHAPLPALADPKRTRDQITGSVHVASSRVRASVALSHATTEPLAGSSAPAVTTTRIVAEGQYRLHGNGQPPTDQTGISLDTPNGAFSEKEPGGSTTVVYGKVSHTLTSNAPVPIKRPAFASGDAATLGIVTARDIGLLSSAGVEVTRDLDNGGARVRAVANFQPTERLPVYIALEAQADAMRTTVGAGLVVTPSPNQFIKGGVEVTLSSQDPGERPGELRWIGRTGIKF